MKDRKARDWLRTASVEALDSSKAVWTLIQGFEQAAQEYHDAARKANRAARLCKEAAAKAKQALAAHDRWTYRLVEEFVSEEGKQDGR